MGLTQPAGQQSPRTAWLMKGMILLGVTLMIVAVVGIVLINRAQTGLAASIGPVRVGMRMDSFTLADLNGNSVRLSDYKGQPVLINAWATWCPPCRAEMPALNSFYQQHRQSGFVILGINAGETQAQAAEFAASYRLEFPILLDPDERLMDQYSIQDFPTTILIGRDGLVKAVHVGMMTPEMLDEQILPYIQ